MITIEQESLTDEAERTGHCEQEQKEPGSSEGELRFSYFKLSQLGPELDV